MKFCHIYFSLLWIICGLILIACLTTKIWWLNDAHCSLRQDPLDQWIALGIVYLLIDRLPNPLPPNDEKEN